MKIGKYISLGTYNNVKVGYGTVDYQNLKTIYVTFNSWVKPDDDIIDYDKLILKSRRTIKNIVYSFDCSRYKKESIVDLNIKTKGIKKDKKSFMNLEVTLFINETLNIRSKEVKNDIIELSNRILINGLDNKKLFNFYKTKK